MSIKQCLALGLLASLSMTAVAQQRNPLNAPAAAPVYESAFKNYRGMADDGETPDKAWRAANDEVGRLGGHVGHMQAAPAASPAVSPVRPEMPSRHAPMHHGHHH